MISKNELKIRVEILDKYSSLVADLDTYTSGRFRLNFNKYADEEIRALGFKTADGCIFVHMNGINGVDYNHSGRGNIDYKVTDRNAVQTVLAYAESKGFPIGKDLAEKAEYKIGTFTLKNEAVEDAEKNVQFHETSYGRKFFDEQLPALIKEIGRLADAVEKYNRLAARTNGEEMIASTEKSDGRE